MSSSVCIGTSLFREFYCLFSNNQSLDYLFIYFLCITNYMQITLSNKICTGSISSRPIVYTDQYYICSLGLLYCCTLRSSTYLSSDRIIDELCFGWRWSSNYFCWTWLCIIGQTLVSWTSNKFGTNRN